MAVETTDIPALYREAARLTRAASREPDQTRWRGLTAEASRLAALGRAAWQAWGDLLDPAERLAAVAAREAYLGGLVAAHARAAARRAAVAAEMAAAELLLRVLWGELVRVLVWGAPGEGGGAGRTRPMTDVPPRGAGS